MGLLTDTKKAADGMLKPKSKGGKPKGQAWRQIGSGKEKSVPGGKRRR